MPDYGFIAGAKGLAKKGKRHELPLLHKSYDTCGYQNHESGVLFEFDNISRKELKEYEAIVIEAFQQLGISLNLFGF